MVFAAAASLLTVANRPASRIPAHRNARTLAAGRSQVNLLATRKREHSRKPDEIFPIIEACSPGPRLELFARGTRPGWTVWGNQADEDYVPTWKTYANHSGADRQRALALEAD